MPSCPKKLMPASSFSLKGCELSYKDEVVKLSTPKGEPMLKGKEVGGLYFFHAKTLYSPKLNKSKKVEEKSIPQTQPSSASKPDITSQRLLKISHPVFLKLTGATDTFTSTNFENFSTSQKAPTQPALHAPSPCPRECQWAINPSREALVHAIECIWT